MLARGPFSLKLATPNEVVDYYKGIFKKHGKGGGLMLNIRLPDQGGIPEVQKMLAQIREAVRY